MSEIPHKWFYRGRQCKMLAPILSANNKLIALLIEQGNQQYYIEMNSDGTFDPELFYELIN